MMSAIQINPQAWQSYLQLLQRFASGDEVDAIEAEVICDEAGRSEADLEIDLDIVYSHRTLRNDQ